MSPEPSMHRAASDGDLARAATDPDGRPLTPRVQTPLKQLLFRRLIPSKTHWKSDDEAAECFNLNCRKPFTMFDRRHHCRRCGNIFCSSCCKDQLRLSQDAQPIDDGVPCRVCHFCFNEHLNRPAETTDSIVTAPPLDQLFVRRPSVDLMATTGKDGSNTSMAGSEGSTPSSVGSDYARDDNTVTFFAERRRTAQFRDQRHNGGRRPSLVAAMLDDNHSWSTF